MALFHKNSCDGFFLTFLTKNILFSLTFYLSKTDAKGIINFSFTQTFLSVFFIPKLRFIKLFLCVVQRYVQRGLARCRNPVHVVNHYRLNNRP